MIVDGPRILIPLDESELSPWALKRGRGLLRHPGAVVHVT